MGQGYIGFDVEYFDRLYGEIRQHEPELFELRLDYVISRLEPGFRVLDVGCGLGWFCAALQERGFDVVGVDVSGEAVRRAQEHWPGARFAACGEDCLPYGDGSFDAVWLGEVLEHVRDGLGLLGEIARVLTPAGLLLGSVPDHGWARRLWLGLSRRAFEAEFEPRADHLRFFTRGTLRALLEAEGYGELSASSRRGKLLFSARVAR